MTLPLNQKQYFALFVLTGAEYAFAHPFLVETVLVLLFKKLIILVMTILSSKEKKETHIKPWLAIF